VNATAERTETPAPDAEKGQLFPLVKIAVDPSDPNVLYLAFSGSIKLDRDDRAAMQLYNDLQHGKSSQLTVDVHVAGSKKTHRRDKDGDVDAVVETKSLIVTSIHHV
jgi:hypothetical protein